MGTAGDFPGRSGRAELKSRNEDAFRMLASSLAAIVKSTRAKKTAGLPMKITDARVILCSPGRNFVTLKVLTVDGLYGLGDATLNGRELAVASYLSDHVIPVLFGRDARQIEIWQYLYKGAYWQRGPVTMCAIAAVDTALWDIKGKSLNTPVCFGSKIRYRRNCRKGFGS